MAVVLPIPGGPENTEMRRRECVASIRLIRRRATEVATKSVMAAQLALQPLGPGHLAGSPLRLGVDRWRRSHPSAPAKVDVQLQCAGGIARGTRSFALGPADLRRHRIDMGRICG